MNDESLLQARIAALAGHINKRKQHPDLKEQAQQVSTSPRTSQFVRGSSRWAPYSQSGRQPPPHAVRNRTLVLGGAQHPQQPLDGHTRAHATDPPVLARSPVVTSRAGARSQLMTKETYEREQRYRKEFERQRASKIAHSGPQRMLPTNTSIASTQAARILEFDGINFELQPDGRKLLRISDPSTATKETPRKVTIADIDFLRTKSGNLIRATSVTQTSSRYQEHWHTCFIRHCLQEDPSRPGPRAPRRQCEIFTRHGTISTCSAPQPFRLDVTIKSSGLKHGGKSLLLTDNALGTCPFGPSCRNRHDPSRLAICKEFFTKGSCPAGKNCDLSHDPTYHRVPACTYFLRGNCTNSACRYAHVTVSTSTLVCRPFATVGYCSKGAECLNRHVFECPDYTNQGRCEAREKGVCPFPHVDRASSLRKVAKRQGNLHSEDDTDLSSDEEEQAVASDADEDSDLDITMGGEDDSHELTQQRDFIEFPSYGRS